MLITNSTPVIDSNEKMAMGKFADASRLGVKNIIFKSPSDSISLNNVSEVHFIGGENKKDNKTDIRIIHDGGNLFNISLKKPDFRSWESADTLIGDYVSEKILEYLMEDLDNNVSNRNFKIASYKEGERIRYKIVRASGGADVKIAYRCGRTDAKRVIFGSDILGKGAIISNNFNSGFDIRGDTVNINVNGMYRSLSNITPDLFPYFQVNSVHENRNQYRFPGLRVEARPFRVLGDSIIINTPLRGLE